MKSKVFGQPLTGSSPCTVRVSLPTGVNVMDWPCASTVFGSLASVQNALSSMIGEESDTGPELQITLSGSTTSGAKDPSPNR